MPGESPSAPQRLRTWEAWGLVAVLLVAVGFGIVVEIRSAFGDVRRTDFGVYARVGWAVRADRDIYAVTDDRGWHFCYPPAASLLFVPFADAPDGEPRSLMLPFAASVAIWFALSVGCLWVCTDRLAAAVERGSAARGSRRWWYARMLPIYLLIVPIGGSLSRGQVTPLLLMMLAMVFADSVGGLRFRSGVWLAGAICLKVIPGFLLLYPLWRRDGRALAGVAMGLLVLVVGVPTLVWGPTGAYARHAQLAEQLLSPAVAIDGGGDNARQTELIGITSTDHQSFEAILHNYRYWHLPLDGRPKTADRDTRLTHLALGGSLTLVALLGYGWKRRDDVEGALLLFGCLVLLMVLCSPASHLHYFCLAMPLVAGLIASSWRRGSGILPDRRTLLLLAFAGSLFALPSIPFWEGRREAGLPMWSCLLLGSMALVRMRRKPATSVAGIAPFTEPLETRNAA